jgi:UDP-glucuronate decarboxylase
MAHSMTNPTVENDIDSIIANTTLDWTTLTNQNILITGISGFFASYLCGVLLRLNKVKNLNINIIGLVRNKEKSYKKLDDFFSDDAQTITLLTQNINEPLNLDSYLNQQQYKCLDQIWHLASQASPKFFSADPVGTYSANVLASHHLLALAKKHQASFVLFSSGAVYGVVNKQPIAEKDYGYIEPVSLHSCYTEAKRMAETMCLSWTHQYALNTKIVRLFHTYGPGLQAGDGRVFADFVLDIVHNRDITLYSDGQASRAFCYISDAVQGFFSILFHGQIALPYNLGNDETEINLKQLAELLVNLYPEKKLQVKLQAKIADTGYISSPNNRRCPDLTRLRALGWQPQVSLADGFKRTIQSFGK